MIFFVVLLLHLSTSHQLALSLSAEEVLGAHLTFYTVLVDRQLLFETRSYYVSQAGLQIIILLSVLELCL